MTVASIPKSSRKIASRSAAGAAGTGKEIGRQAQKSALTRKLIVEAALSCLIKYGYANTSTPRIAEEAGLSRGAMMHHFSNRNTMIQAAIEYLHSKRLRAFKRAVSSLPSSQPHLHDALIAYGKHVSHPLFVAFYELAVAARTDKELEVILRPAQEAFYRAWYDLAADLFPEWQSNRRKFILALNFVQSTLEGLAIRKLSSDISQREEEDLFRYLEECLQGLMPKGN